MESSGTNRRHDSILRDDSSFHDFSQFSDADTSAVFSENLPISPMPGDHRKILRRQDSDPTGQQTLTVPRKSKNLPSVGEGPINSEFHHETVMVIQVPKLRRSNSLSDSKAFANRSSLEHSSPTGTPVFGRLSHKRHTFTSRKFSDYTKRKFSDMKRRASHDIHKLREQARRQRREKKLRYQSSKRQAQLRTMKAISCVMLVFLFMRIPLIVLPCIMFVQKFLFEKGAIKGPISPIQG